jgi:hypothetical protein
MSTRPFSNGFEWDAWSAGWCAWCLNEETCPLLDLVFIEGRTPQEWQPGADGVLGPTRYFCTAFQLRPEMPTLYPVRPPV